MQVHAWQWQHQPTFLLTLVDGLRRPGTPDTAGTPDVVDRDAMAGLLRLDVDASAAEERACGMDVVRPPKMMNPYEMGTRTDVDTTLPGRSAPSIPAVGPGEARPEAAGAGMTLQLRQHSDLDGTAAAATARKITRHFFDDALRGGRSVPPEVMDTTLLLVSELVTNAIRHTEDGCVLDLELEPDEIAIDVTDYSDAEPRLRAPDLEGGGGWGWALVHELGSDVRIRHRPGGKTIHTGVRLFPPD